MGVFPTLCYILVGDVIPKRGAGILHLRFGSEPALPGGLIFHPGYYELLVEQLAEQIGAALKKLYRL
jgi:hypothetical protein